LRLLLSRTLLLILLPTLIVIRLGMRGLGRRCLGLRMTLVRFIVLMTATLSTRTKSQHRCQTSRRNNPDRISPKINVFHMRDLRSQIRGRINRPALL
jgi:hypothetical protein